MRDIKTEANLPVALTADELQDRGERLARTLGELDKLDEEITAYKANIKAQVDELNAQKNVLKTAINTRREYRMVPCAWKYDWKAGVKTLTRNDTKEIVNKIPVTEEERQEGLRLSGAKECPVCKHQHSRKGKYCSPACKKTADAEAKADKRKKAKEEPGSAGTDNGKPQSESGE
jgi:hypothetical protein